MRIPFSAFLLSDEWSLTAYEHHEHVGSADMLMVFVYVGKDARYAQARLLF